MSPKFDRHNPQLPSIDEVLSVVKKPPIGQITYLKDLFVLLSKEKDFFVLEQNSVAIDSLLDKKGFSIESKKLLLDGLSSISDYRLGRGCQSRKFYDEALLYYEKVQEGEKHYYEAQVNIGSIHFFRENYSVALEYFKKAHIFAHGAIQINKILKNIESCKNQLLLTQQIEEKDIV